MMNEMDGGNEPQRRRSARLSPLQTNQTNATKMALAAAASVKRSIIVRKIAPRKTTLAPSQHNKENTPNRATLEGIQHKKLKLSTPENVPTPSSSSEKKPKKSVVPSPILPSPQLTLRAQTLGAQAQKQTPRAQAQKQSPGAQAQKQTQRAQTEKQNPGAQAQKQSPGAQAQKQTQRAQTEKQNPGAQAQKQALEVQSENQQPAVDPSDVAWSQKVRRSYSCLSDRSFSPNSRLTLFGFERLQTPAVMRREAGRSLGASGSFSGLASFTSLLEAEECEAPVDPHIPGVALVKEKKKRRRRKVPQINGDEIDALAAKMNAEFEEADGFELLVE